MGDLGPSYTRVSILSFLSHILVPKKVKRVSKGKTFPGVEFRGFFPADLKLASESFLWRPSGPKPRGGDP